MNRQHTIVLIFLTLTVTTATVFFLQTPVKVAANWLSIGFLLFSELAICTGFYFLIKIKKDINRLFTKAGISSVLSLYFLGTLLLACFANFFHDKTNTLIAIELLLIAISAILIVLILAFARKTSEVDAQATYSYLDQPKRGKF